MPDQNQHYVPKFLLRNFVDTDGRVYCLNKKTDKITKPPPKFAAAHNNFNDFLIGEKVRSFEDRLQKIESKAASAFRKIIKQTSLTSLLPNERHHISDFIAVQAFRTEAFRQGLGSEVDKTQIGHIFEQLWNSSFLTSAEIERRRWTLLKIDHDDLFYLGDNPVVLQNPENKKLPESLGFDIIGTEVFLPLTPKLALYMPCRSTSNKIIDIVQGGLRLQQGMIRAMRDGRPLREMMEELRTVNLVLGTSKNFYDAILTGTPFVATPENVENLNYLQCSWAHESIYSATKNFKFAQHVLINSPQYRESPKTHIAKYGS